jgi:hypothetical protein
LALSTLSKELSGKMNHNFELFVNSKIRDAKSSLDAFFLSTNGGVIAKVWTNDKSTIHAIQDALKREAFAISNSRKFQFNYVISFCINDKKALIFLDEIETIKHTFFSDNYVIDDENDIKELKLFELTNSFDQEYPLIDIDSFTKLSDILCEDFYLIVKKINVEYSRELFKLIHKMEKFMDSRCHYSRVFWRHFLSNVKEI